MLLALSLQKVPAEVIIRLTTAGTWLLFLYQVHNKQHEVCRMTDLWWWLGQKAGVMSAWSVCRSDLVLAQFLPECPVAYYVSRKADFTLHNAAEQIACKLCLCEHRVDTLASLPVVHRLLCASGHPCSMACLAGARRTASMLCLAPQWPLLLQKTPKATRMATEGRLITSQGSLTSTQGKKSISNPQRHPW